MKRSMMVMVSMIAVALVCSTSAMAGSVFLDVVAGSAANGWNTTPVNLSAPGVLDWYVGNNQDAVHGYSVGSNWWNWVYTSPGNEKAGGTILSNFLLKYTDKGYTGGHTIDQINKVLFSYTDGVAPVSETDVLARTNWMSDKTTDGIMSLRAEVGVNQLYLTQWFNYSDELEYWPKGHTLTATLYDAGGGQLNQASWSAPSGLQYGFINPYTATISVQGGNAGDYLILEHSTSNIGYRGTMVTLIPEPVTMAGLMLGIGSVVTYVRKRRTA